MLSVALSVMLASATARGDGVCDMGYRDTTSSERETMTRVLETAKRALPPPPDGWIVVGDDAVSVAGSICRDYESTPWRYHYTRYYQRVDDQAARDELIAAAGADMAADFKAKQPRLDAIVARNLELSQAAMAAAQQGDYQRVDEINRELDAAGQEYQRILDEGGAPERMNAAIDEASRDLEMQIAVDINAGSEAPDQDAQSLAVPAGAQTAFRWAATRGSVTEAHALILLGQWRPTGEGRFELVPRSNRAAVAAHGAAIRVTAADNRLVAMLDAIDWGGMQAALAD